MTHDRSLATRYRFLKAAYVRCAVRRLRDKSVRQFRFSPELDRLVAEAHTTLLTLKEQLQRSHR